MLVAEFERVVEERLGDHREELRGVHARVVIDHLAGANGLANPGTLFSPVLGSYTVVGFLPPALSGLNLSTMIVNLASDPGFNPVNLGVADSHEIQVN